MLQKIKRRLKQVGIFAGVFFIIALVFSPSEEEAQAQKQKDIKTIELEIKKSKDYYTISTLYKKLLDLDPTNNDFKLNYEKFLSLDSFLKVCRIKTRDRDQNSLKFPSSYNEKIRAGKFINENTILLSSKFTGENILEQTYSFKTMYKCSILKDKKIKVIQTLYSKVN